jgi:hypothetical protein
MSATYGQCEKCGHTPKYDTTGNIIRYEMGDLTYDETVELFAHLIKTGMAWSLQGSYGRTAQSFIENGVISREGKVW